MHIRFWNQPYPVHPDWVSDASRSIADSVRLLENNLLPRTITSGMLVIPCRRYLRGIYGSDFRAVWFLFWMACASLRERLHNRIYCFWRYRVELHSPEADLNEMLDENVEEE